MDEAFKGTVVNSALQSLHGESLEITLTSLFMETWKYGELSARYCNCLSNITKHKISAEL